MPHTSLRIALVAPLWHPIIPDRGGIEQIVYLLAQYLHTQGHRVTLLAAGGSAAPGRLVAIYPEGLVSAMSKGDIDQYAYIEGMAIAETLQRASEFDIIHSHLTGSLAPFSALCPVPMLHTLHTPITNDLRWLLGRFPCAHVNVVSHGQAAALPLDKRIPIIANGIDLAEYPLCLTPQEYLLFLGRMEEKKGAHLAIEAARALQRPLKLAGPIVDRNYFQQHIVPAVDGHTIHYLGPVQGSEKKALLQQAMGVLFPTLQEEAFGLVMIEAMACGTPVVGLRRGAVPEIITPGVNGFYADAPAELPILVKRLGELNRLTVRQSIQERFSYQRMGREYVALYQQLLGEAARGLRGPFSMSKARFA